jgi:hypothetical protein
MIAFQRNNPKGAVVCITAASKAVRVGSTVGASDKKDFTFGIAWPQATWDEFDRLINNSVKR